MLSSVLKLIESDASEKKDTIAVDLDKTLAYYDGNFKPGVIGEPIPKMLARVRQWIKDGETVVIFTARAHDPKEVEAVKRWCAKYVGQVLDVTNIKRPDFKVFYDDRAVGIIANTGEYKSFTSNNNSDWL